MITSDMVVFCVLLNTLTCLLTRSQNQPTILQRQLIIVFVSAFICTYKVDKQTAQA